MALLNKWHLRKVAEQSAKPCDICYKPTPSVLITPDNKDHFYVCPGHLKDRGFCSPVVDEAEVAAKKKREELEREIEAVKKEYEEKVKVKKKKKGKEAKEKGSKGKEKEGEEKEGEEDQAAAKEKDEKIKALSNQSTLPNNDEIPRIYTLQKVFYQKRIDRIRNAEIAKRNRERFKNPTLFPSVPHGDLG